MIYSLISGPTLFRSQSLGMRLDNVHVQHTMLFLLMPYYFAKTIMVTGVYVYCLCIIISIRGTSCPLTVLEAIKYCTNLVELT